MGFKQFFFISLFGLLSSSGCKSASTELASSPDGGFAGQSCVIGQCTGCCYQGICVDGRMDSRCGYGGGPCISCTMETESKCFPVANGGVCSQCTRNCTTPSGGTKTCGASDGCGGPCWIKDKCTPNASSCQLTCTQGCCDGETCISKDKQSDTLCGHGGETCLDCKNTQPGTPFCDTTKGECLGECSQRCLRGCCKGQTCLEPPNSERDSSCGKNGDPCADCTAPEYEGTPICNRSTGQCQIAAQLCKERCADGCCSGQGCKKNLSGDSKNRYCGKGGEDCENCTKLPVTPFCNTNTGKCIAERDLCINSCQNGCCNGESCVHQPVGDDVDKYCGNDGTECKDCTSDEYKDTPTCDTDLGECVPW